MIHGYKKKHKTIINLLRTEEAKKVPCKEKVERLTKAKSNCSTKINLLKKNRIKKIRRKK